MLHSSTQNLIESKQSMIIMRLLTITLLSLVVWANAQSEYPEWINGTFPDDFEWGLATASYQIEGGWNVDGKGENIWDRFTHADISPIDDNSTGNVACDSYNRYQVDVQLVRNIGAQFYRFSVSWTRVIPTGRFADGINEAGIDYYNNLINDLIASNIEPFITIYHWDLPQPLQDVNGWQNEAIVNEFEAYAGLLFNRFGDRVKKWITFNEPFVFCMQGHSDGSHAPGISIPATAPYQCAHNVIRSHARAYRLYETTYKDTQQGIVGITLDCTWYEPRDPNNANDVAASERALLFKHGWFAFPIFNGGDYPQVMRDNIRRKSDEDGLAVSRLPEFTEDEKRMINGTADFLGFNHYTTNLVEHANSTDRGLYGDQDTSTSYDPTWPPSAANWLYHVPWGFRKLLVWINRTYNNPIVYVTENGFSDHDDVGLNDDARITYFREYINEMLKAVTIDNCNVKGYTAWSLMDNFEWARGYTERFGIYWVNYTHPHRTRIPKRSAAVIQKIFRENGFPELNSSTSIIVVSVITYVFAFAAVMYGTLF